MPTDASDLNLASIGIAELAGSQTVIRTVTSVADKAVKWKVKVDEPDGYDVTVTPDELTLNPGDAATYEVTITNNGGGPVGEWRFGSLEWKGEGYRAYSPIAVNGALFDAPPVVSGSGTSGSASFAVNFGYTGAYTAAPHGLSAEAPETGDISQDADQTYTPGEVSGGVDLITFPVSASAFVRWSMTISGPDDIDLFLENSAGTIIASSTNGGTDELIELAAAGRRHVHAGRARLVGAERSPCRTRSTSGTCRLPRAEGACRSTAPRARPRSGRRGRWT